MANKTNKKQKAKSNKQTKKNKPTQAGKSDIIQDESEDNIGTKESKPSTVEAAYWEEKAGKAKKEVKDGAPRDVDDYVSNIFVEARPNESTEQLLRRFNSEVRDTNLIDEIRQRQEYEKPSQKRKREKKLRLQRRHQRED